MIVFDRDGPLPRESEFDAGPHDTTPPGFARRREGTARPHAGPSSDGRDRGVRYAVIFVVGERRPALHIREHIVPGVADLAGEETDRIDLGLVQERHAAEGADRAGVGPVQIGPVALGLHAEHPVGRLPTIADLTADQAPRRVVTTQPGRHRNAAGPTIVARCAAGVETDIEAAPIIEWRDHRRRLCVGRCREIRACRAREGHRRSKSNSNHCQSPHSNPQCKQKR